MNIIKTRNLQLLLDSKRRASASLTLTPSGHGTLELGDNVDDASPGRRRPLIEVHNDLGPQQGLGGVRSEQPLVVDPLVLSGVRVVGLVEPLDRPRGDAPELGDILFRVGVHHLIVITQRVHIVSCGLTTHVWLPA